MTRRAAAGQLGLFDRPYTPFVKSSPTSKAAAVQAEPTSATAEARVLEVIRASGSRGATDDEIEQATAMTHQGASARRRGLVLRGRVRDSGETRATRYGRKATVWVLV